MITLILSGFAVALILEGLVFALAPLRLEMLIRAVSDLPTGRRRGIGIAAIFAGVLLLWLLRAA